MLDLQPSVHLQEVEARPVVGLLEEELDRARAAVAHRPSRPYGDLSHRRPDLFTHLRTGRRRLLDDLLVPALHGAVALAEVHHVAVRIGHQLDLHVAGLHHRPLHEDPIVAERGQGLAGRGLEGGA